MAAFTAVGVFSVVSALGAQNQNTGTRDTTQPVNEPVTASEATTTTGVGSGEVTGYGIEATDTTSTAAAQSGAEADRTSQDQDIAVTDTTLPSPEPEQAAAQAGQAPTTTTIRVVSSTTSTTPAGPPVPRRVLHPTWDHRLPSTWEGLPATECNKETFRIEMRYYDNVTSWDHFPEGWTPMGPADAEASVIGLALADPSYEVEPGRAGYAKLENALAKRGRLNFYPTPFEDYCEVYKELREALTDLGVSSAQDIRDMGEPAANVRWYAAHVKRYIDRLSLNPDHPSCASILAGAEAVLTPYQPTTTTPLTGN
ncbi:MAG: hypothetical protein OXK16_02105 [bacterium]|nr:hypothetical protein [bacterium]